MPPELYRVSRHLADYFWLTHLWHVPLAGRLLLYLPRCPVGYVELPTSMSTKFRSAWCRDTLYRKPRPSSQQPPSLTPLFNHNCRLPSRKSSSSVKEPSRSLPYSTFSLSPCCCCCPLPPLARYSKDIFTLNLTGYLCSVSCVLPNFPSS